MFFLFTLGGDQDLPIENYKKHYRIRHPVVADNLDRLRHMIRTEGIASVAVFGGDGVCVLNQPGVGQDVATFASVVDAAVAKIKGPNRRKEAFVDGGTVYPPAVKAQGRVVRERMPAVAAGPDGEVWLAFVSDEAGSNDVFVTAPGRSGGKPIPVADSPRDEYAPAIVATGKGEALVVWVGEDEKGRYDLWAATVAAGKAGKARRVTKSPDDAMAPALAAAGGDVWLAWYEWRQMDGLSRDREVFVARGDSFAEAVQVSPREVPAYEDHADPAVAADGKGGAFVAWAWDYHGTLPGKPPVDENSIFVRHVGRDGKTGPVLTAGFRGEGRARDYFPSIALGEGGLPFVGWDNSHKASAGDKAVFVNRLAGEDFGVQTEVAANAGPLCSPRVLADGRGAVHAVWGALGPDGWAVWTRRFAPGEPTPPVRLKVAAKTPRYAAPVFDSEGRLWVAYTDVGEREWKVRLEKVD